MTDQITTTATTKLWGSRADFTPAQLDAYLVHLGLDPQDIRGRSCDYELLTLLHNRHYLSVPFETTAIHIPDTLDEERLSNPLTFGAGAGVSLDLDTLHDRIVRQKKGSYCFGLNVAYSALLRGVGFKVVELCARVNELRDEDPQRVGYRWAGINHIKTLAVDTSNGRYLSDVGWPRGSFDFPIKLAHNALSNSMREQGVIQLRNEAMPVGDPNTFRNADSWTLWCKGHDPRTKQACWLACYCFNLHPYCPADFEVLNYFNWSYPAAVFTTILYATKLLPDGTRQILLYSAEMVEGQHAKFLPGNRGGEEKIRVDVRTIKGLLKGRFGFED